MKNNLNIKITLIGILLLLIDIFLIGQHTYYWFIEDRVIWRSDSFFDSKFGGYILFLFLSIITAMIISYGLGFKNKLSNYGEKICNIYSKIYKKEHD